MAKVLQFLQNSVSGRTMGRSSKTDTETRIAGLKELVAGLQALPAALETKAVWSALGGAGAVVKNAARANAPVLSRPTPGRKPGTVRDAIRVSRSKINKGQNGRYEVIVRVKPLKGKKVAAFKQQTGLRSDQNPDDPFYWWFLEFGTSKMSPRPFLRAAFESTKDAQLSAMRKRMKAFLDKEAAKIAQEVKRAA